MVLLSCSGTGGGIHTNLANGGARHNCTRAPLPTIHRCYDLLRVINKRIIAESLGDAVFLGILRATGQYDSLNATRRDTERRLAGRDPHDPHHRNLEIRMGAGFAEVVEMKEILVAGVRFELTTFGL